MSEFEKKHVVQVYEAIAEHFSDTRHKPWPVIDQFLKDQPVGSLGADVGCGNGKYLIYPHLYTIGSDITKSLIQICHKKGFESLVADGTHLPYRSECFDFVICIAVIHHFSTEERRIQAIRELLRITKNTGKVLIFVWAMEQTNAKRKFEEGKQDVMVSWKLPKNKYTSHANATMEDEKNKTFERYYHLFKKGELEELIQKADRNAVIDAAGYDRDNWYAICHLP